MFPLLLLLLLPLLVFAKDQMASRSSVVHLMQNFSDIHAMLDALPKECCKNGKTYKEGEEFEVGHLRYKCQKYGVYSIEGCVTGTKKKLKLGETVVVDNVKSQCLGKGSSVYYRETVCGIMGQPECDKIDLPSGFKEAQEREKSQPQAKAISLPGLPPGWKVVDETHQEIPGSGGRQVVSRTLMFEPIIGGQSRARRQSGHGIASVVAIEDVGTDKPPMPMSMLLNGGKSPQSEKKGTTPTIQNVSRTLVIQEKSKERVVGVGTGSKDLHSRTPTISNTKGLKPESVAGSRSDVNWKGRTIVVNGKTIGTGEGTFTFGNSPTGAAAKKGH
ncbi:hypothetical protein GCK32_009313 [Trichostrongylus colubriformis]|uniref:Abnormal cell migration protein 18-like fibronectin type I domain-containing protein n=1 Tax=Trichostrongylus colubriformis TaxID=6319 RepID=A0AAN8FFS7_TRICO